jgi:hypothetical protein
VLTLTTSTKRRQSSFSDNSSKRPRLSPEALKEQKHVEKVESVESRTSIPERRKSGQLEERQRGKRLFGALLGTLAQSSSSTAHKRRLDIEKKQQEKLKQQAEDDDEKRKVRLEALLQIRRKEQEKYDKQAVCQKGAPNMLRILKYVSDANKALELACFRPFLEDESRTKTGIRRSTFSETCTN